MMIKPNFTIDYNEGTYKLFKFPSGELQLKLVSGELDENLNQEEYAKTPSLLKVRFENGKFYNKTNITQIKSRLDGSS